jgi:hypothetical protein
MSRMSQCTGAVQSTVAVPPARRQDQRAMRVLPPPRALAVAYRPGSRRQARAAVQASATTTKDRVSLPDGRGRQVLPHQPMCSHSPAQGFLRCGCVLSSGMMQWAHCHMAGTCVGAWPIAVLACCCWRSTDGVPGWACGHDTPSQPRHFPSRGRVRRIITRWTESAVGRGSCASSTVRRT